MSPVISDDPNDEPTYRVELPDLTGWPDDADVAVCLTYDTQGAIDGFREGYQTATWAGGQRNYSDYSERQYGITEGLPRILDLHDKYGVKGTFPTCGLTAEWYPEAIGEIADRGHEVANHSHEHHIHASLDRETEREDIRRSTDALAEAVGERPTGWRTPLYSIGEHTLDLLLDHGYAWDSSLHDYDRPYVLTDGERSIVELPASMDDHGMYVMDPDPGSGGPHMGGYWHSAPEQVLNVVQWEFDHLYDEARRTGEPRTFVYTMHPKVSGRPHRAEALRRFLEHATDKPGVWFPTLSELAATVSG